MKNLSVLLILILFSSKVYSQCSVNKEELGAGMTSYLANPESIYFNNEGGIQEVNLQLLVFQKKDGFNYVIGIDVTSGGTKPKIAPRELNFLFTDGSKINLKSDRIFTNNVLNGLTKHNCLLKFSSDEYARFKNNSIKSIEIFDNRLKEKIVAQPYAELIQEQANCIAKEIN